jgi:hypothetical protein
MCCGQITALLVNFEVIEVVACEEFSSFKKHKAVLFDFVNVLDQFTATFRLQRLSQMLLLPTPTQIFSVLLRLAAAKVVLEAATNRHLY